MSDEWRTPEDCQEDDVARLIRAGFGAAARPGPRASEETFRHLVAGLRAQQSAAGFPDRIVVLLIGVLVLMGAWVANLVMGPDVPPTTALPTLVVVGLLAVNLGLVPMASLVIVWRRRYA